MKTLSAVLIAFGFLLILDFFVNPPVTVQQEYTNQGLKAPELVGISGYINSDPSLSIASLKGKVVLVDFWTYSCINCLRTLPHEIDLYNKYGNNGLVIIGVHTPEFDFEKVYANVAKAVMENNIFYPVVLDNNYQTWSAFANRFWPHKYLIDANGIVRYDVIGEGQYDVTEQHVRDLLLEAGYNVSDMNMSSLPDTTPNTINTPELYLGYSFALPRGEDIGNTGGLNVGVVANYSAPTSFSLNTVFLNGSWLSGSDSIISYSNDSSVFLYYSAKSVNIVSQPSNYPVNFTIRLDGSYLTNSNAGVDVLFDGNVSYVTVSLPRLYNIVSTSYGYHTLNLTADYGFQLNTFTFG